MTTKVYVTYLQCIYLFLKVVVYNTITYTVVYVCHFNSIY